jgi:hypothetical protein
MTLMSGNGKTVLQSPGYFHRFKDWSGTQTHINPHSLDPAEEIDFLAMGMNSSLWLKNHLSHLAPAAPRTERFIKRCCEAPPQHPNTNAKAG